MKIRIKVSIFLYSLSIYFNCAKGDPDPRPVPFVSSSYSQGTEPHSAFSLASTRYDKKSISPTTKTFFQFGPNSTAMTESRSQPNRIGGIMFQSKANISVENSEINLTEAIRGDRSVSKKSSPKTKSAPAVAKTKPSVKVSPKTKAMGRIIAQRKNLKKHAAFRLVSKRQWYRGRAVDQGFIKPGTGGNNHTAGSNPAPRGRSLNPDEDAGEGGEDKIEGVEDGEGDEDNGEGQHTSENTDGGYKDDEVDENKIESEEGGDSLEIEDVKLDISHQSAKALCRALDAEFSPAIAETRSYLWAPIYQYAPALGRGFPLVPPMFTPECLKWQLKPCNGTARFPMMSPCTYWAPMPIRTEKCFQYPKTLEVYKRGRLPKYNKDNCPCLWPCTPFFDPIQQCRANKQIDLETWFDKFDVFGNSNASSQIPHHKAMQLCHGIRSFINQETPVQIKSIPIRIQSLAGPSPDDQNKCLAWRFTSCHKPKALIDSFEEQDEGYDDEEGNIGWKIDEDHHIYEPPDVDGDKPAPTHDLTIGLGIGIGIGIVQELQRQKVQNNNLDGAAPGNEKSEESKTSEEPESEETVESEETTTPEPDIVTSESEETTVDPTDQGYTFNPMTGLYKKGDGEWYVAERETTPREFSIEIEETTTTEDPNEKGFTFNPMTGENIRGKRSVGDNIDSPKENLKQTREKRQDDMSPKIEGMSVEIEERTTNKSEPDPEENTSTKTQRLLAVDEDSPDETNGEKIIDNIENVETTTQAEELNPQNSDEFSTSTENPSVPFHDTNTEQQCGVWVKVQDDECMPETPAPSSPTGQTSTRAGVPPSSDGSGLVQMISPCPGGWPCFLGKEKRFKRDATISYPLAKSSKMPLGGGRASQKDNQADSSKPKSIGGHRRSRKSKYHRYYAKDKLNRKARSATDGDQGMMTLSDMSKIEKGPECRCDWPCLPFFDPINKCYNEQGDLLVDEKGVPAMLPRQLSSEQKPLVQCMSYLEDDQIDCNIKYSKTHLVVSI